MRLTLGGMALVLDWSETYPRKPVRQGDRLRIGGPEAQLGARLIRWLRQEALVLLTQETAEFAQKAGVSITSIGVGDPVSRWGSCAASGAIRYSWRLILAPSFVRRATVAHEVAHRVHMDHSPRFHALVATLLGTDPAPARRWLRANAATIQGFGRAS
jgi:predicted metal-dependent hydrolase